MEDASGDVIFPYRFPVSRNPPEIDVTKQEMHW
jgi:hypothetical protein